MFKKCSGVQSKIDLYFFFNLQLATVYFSSSIFYIDCCSSFQHCRLEFQTSSIIFVFDLFFVHGIDLFHWLSSQEVHSEDLSAQSSSLDYTHTRMVETGHIQYLVSWVIIQPIFAFRIFSCKYASSPGGLTTNHVVIQKRTM